MKKPKNSIKTPAYFCKRLRDNGFIVLKLFNGYSIQDPRRWTILVDPGKSSTFVTCFSNKNFNGDVMFEINDGGIRFPKNFILKTESIEVVISYLIRHGVSNDAKTSPYYMSPVRRKEDSDERRTEQAQETAEK
jgi:hypothetical protein